MEELKTARPDYEVVDQYTGARTKIRHRHIDCGTVWPVSPDNMLRGSGGCPTCRYKRKTDEDYANELADRSPEYEVLEPYKTSYEPILHRHKVCGHEWKARPNGVLRGAVKCPACKLKKMTKSHEQYVQELKETRPDFEALEPYVNNYTKILHRHKVCGHEWKIVPHALLHKDTCPVCSISKAETFIRDFLTANSIRFAQQYKFDDCCNINQLPFDFAIFDKQGELAFLIEYQGIQHFKTVTFFGGPTVLKDIKARDKIKRQYARKNGIKLLELTHKDSEDEIINKILEQAQFERGIPA